MKFNQLAIMIDHDLKAGNTPLLLGLPGIGKSSCARALARKMDTKVFSLQCNHLGDRTDITGARSINDNNVWKQIFFPHATVAECIEYAKANPDKNPILFLDEINRTSEDITSAVLSFTTELRVGTTDIPENVRFIVAGNDKGNVHALDSASISRFSMYRAEPDIETFFELDLNLHPIIKKILEANPDMLCEEPTVNADFKSEENEDDDGNVSYQDEMTNFETFFDESEFIQITVPRTIVKMSNFMNTFTDEELAMTVMDGSFAEAVYAHIGKTKLAEHIINDIQASLLNDKTENPTVEKPDFLDGIRSLSQRDEQLEEIDKLTTDNKYKLVKYLLYERADNSELIEMLNPYLDESNKEITKLIINGQAFQPNVQVLLNGNSALARSINAVL